MMKDWVSTSSGEQQHVMKYTTTAFIEIKRRRNCSQVLLNKSNALNQQVSTILIKADTLTKKKKHWSVCSHSAKAKIHQQWSCRSNYFGPFIWEKFWGRFQTVWSPLFHSNRLFTRGMFSRQFPILLALQQIHPEARPCCAQRTDC